MAFTDTSFFIFLAIVFSAYYAVSFSGRWQLAALILGSATFYAWDNPRLLILLITVGITAGAASFAIREAQRPALKKLVLVAAITGLLAVLGFFKYGGLLYGTLIGAGRSPQWEKFFLAVPLPIGISFYIFHAISLMVDVSRGTYKLPPRISLLEHLSRTGLYISFFPQLIAGPITKARDFYPQIEAKRFADIDWHAVLHFLILGYFFKLVVADNLAVQTGLMTYPYFQSRAGLQLVVLMIGYSCQIFADFYGYSLLAMGFAGLFGYRLPQNFNRPYIATSFADFWRRWHMSLSTWLKDYLYVPLGGSRKGGIRTYVNLFIVMFLGGLWHGAAWSFAIWGSVHGLALAIERPFLKSRFYQSESLGFRAARLLLVFAVVTTAWLFFRLEDYAQAGEYFRTIVVHARDPVQKRTLLNVLIYCILVGCLHISFITNWIRSRRNILTTVYAAMLFLIVTNSGVPGAFIYFRF